MKRGIIFDIQKFCVHDGPGIRTSVFLKGCMMRCIWCHNPESFELGIQIARDNLKCSLCGKCAEICPQKVHHPESGKMVMNPQNCVKCGRCIEECPQEALRFFGREVDADEVIEEVLKDRKYYESSGGGVTFTGGEPTLQFEFLMELLMKSKEANLHTCLETNGIIPHDNLEKLCPYVDLFLLDYKATGNEEYKRFTGVEPHMFFSTLDYLESQEKPVILRCPVVQGLNDTDVHFEAIKELKGKYRCIQSVEIMPYHSLGRQKWEAIGREYTLEHLESATPELKELWESKIG